MATTDVTPFASIPPTSIWATSDGIEHEFSNLVARMASSERGAGHNRTDALYAANVQIGQWIAEGKLFLVPLQGGHYAKALEACALTQCGCFDRPSSLRIEESPGHAHCIVCGTTLEAEDDEGRTVFVGAENLGGEYACKDALACAARIA